MGRYRKRAGVQYPQSLWTLFLAHHNTLTVGISSVRRESTNGGFEGCTPLQLRSTYVSCYWPFLLQLHNDIFLRFQVLTKIHSRTSPNSTFCTLQNSVISLGTDNQLSTLLTGVKYPIFAACASAVWSISRISYTRGYITGDPKKARNLFILFYPAKLITFAPISQRVGPMYVLGSASTIGGFEYP